MLRNAQRVILVEPVEARRTVLAERLRSQGYEVEALATGIEAATVALSSPPQALIADLFMPGVSGVQLCRLLRCEPATAGVPVILRGPSDTPRQRFWASRAGAAAYVAKGRIAELARALEKATLAPKAGAALLRSQPDEVDVRDRISHELDRALYDSVLASEVRALSTCENLPYLFDRLSQFLCEVMTYRWLAVLTSETPRLCVHAHPATRELAIEQARAALGADEHVPVICIEDEDANAQPNGPGALVQELAFGSQALGRCAVAPRDTEPEDAALVELVARELGGPIRIVTLVEQTERMASNDPLTGIMNRRAFGAALEREFAQAERLGIEISLLLLDVDRFKSVNDTYGHQAGDRVLTAIGQLLPKMLRTYDYAARWGGEEFVIALPHADQENGVSVAERVRSAVAALTLTTGGGEPLPVTVSIGVAARTRSDTPAQLLERADQAMYAAKRNGRNCVVAAEAKVRILESA
ncbi:MAG TPA: diguanylate cyclase [Polyangiaceae bacterium]